jgi:SHS2 domain-containing protein
MDQNWRILDHTADVRLEIHGTTLEDLFINAAYALTNLLTSDVSGSIEDDLTISVEGTDKEELLVAWLREILYHNQVNGFLLLHISNILLSNTQCEARLYGRSRKPHEEPEMEIKGVTYHGLTIDQKPDRAVALVVFDI